MPRLSSIIRFSFPQFNSYLIFSILLFSPLIEGGTTYYPVAISQFLILVILTGEIYSFYRRERQYLSIKTLPFHAILLFMIYSLIIAILTPYKLPAFQQIQLYIFYAILFYFSTLYVLTHDQYQMKIIKILYFMGLFEAITGSVQYFVFHQRAKGTFFNPDFFGEYLAIIFCVHLGRYFEGYKSKLYQWAALGFIPILATGIIISQSRGAAIAWIVGASFVLWKRFKIKAVYVWMIFLFLFTLIPNPLRHRFLYDYREDPYSLSRFDMWKEAIHIIQDRPMGIGLEMYPLISPQYAFPVKGPVQQYGKVAESPHNEYLRLFSEMGIIGGILFLGSVGFFFLKWTDKRNQSSTQYGILGATFVFFVHAMVDSNFHEPALVITIIVLSTLLLDKRLFHLSSYPSPFTPHPSRFIMYFLLIVFFLLFCFFIIKPPVGWYYYSNGYNQIKNHQEEAELNFRKALFWENQSARYHNALANAYFNTFQKTNYYGWIFKALEELNQALSLNPIDGSYFKLRGEIYQALAERERESAKIQELLDDAFTNYREALRLLPYDISLYVALGSAEEASGKTDDGEKHYNQAILIEPNYLLAREKKIGLLLKLGKKEEALNNYQELVSVHDRIQKIATSDVEKAFIYFNQEKLEKAVKEAK